MSPRKIVLFAEGSLGQPTRRGDPFVRLWRRLLVRELELRPIARVVPIDKRVLVAMDPDSPAMSGASVGLDELILREIEGDGIDVAVAAWDLLPPWDPAANACRWNECLNLYRHLSRSDVLPDEWRDDAASRYSELRARPSPGARVQAPGARPNSVLAVCMEPMFEAILTACEAGVRRALGVEGRGIRDWPPWSDHGEIDRRVIQPALSAARAVRPTPAVFRQIRGDFRTAKHEWAEYLLRELFADERCRDQLVRTSFCQRLIEVIGAKGSESE